MSGSAGLTGALSNTEPRLPLLSQELPTQDPANSAAAFFLRIKNHDQLRSPSTGLLAFVRRADQGLPVTGRRSGSR